MPWSIRTWRYISRCVSLILLTMRKFKLSICCSPSFELHDWIFSFVSLLFTSFTSSQTSLVFGISISHLRLLISLFFPTLLLPWTLDYLPILAITVVVRSHSSPREYRYSVRQDTRYLRRVVYSPIKRSISSIHPSRLAPALYK